jgi:hypothetical protein
MHSLFARRLLLALAVAGLTTVASHSASAITTGFETLTPNAQYAAGSYIHADDLNFRVPPGSFSSIHVKDWNNAGGGGNELLFAFRGALQFILPAGVDEISFRFSQGETRFSINGANSPFMGFHQANGLVVGGVTISVAFDSGSNTRGVTRLLGPIQSFTFTGTEVSIDNVFVDAVATSADFDADGDVDGADFLRWQRGVGSPTPALAQGDADMDADVDGADLVVWRGKWKATQPPVTTVPEPAALTAVHVLPIFTAVLRRRWV